MMGDHSNLDQIQETLHVEIIPGTEIMTDVGNIHLKHAANHGYRVLVPQPSSDPHDPLNWSRTWKALAMAGMAISSFANGFGPLSEAPQVPYYIAEWDITLPEALQTIGICVLVLGFSNLIWVPVARAFGRRPMLLVANAIGIASCIWRAKATSYNSFIGACALSGIGAGPGETLGPMLVADVMFLHERGLYMGLYMWSYWIGVMLGPVVAGVMTERYGWRSFWWCNTTVCIFALAYQIVLLPETKWNRGTDFVEAQSGSQTAQPATHMSEFMNDEIPEKPSVDAVENGTAPNSTPPSEEEILVKLSGAPSTKQFLPYQGFDNEERIFEALWLPFKLFAFPIVQWSSFVFSWVASCFLVANLTQSQAFAGPPWNLSAASVGYTNFAIFIGASIALLTAGPLSDWVSMRATIKNKGIREPEMRLPAILPFACATLVGGLILAMGYQHGWSWEVIVIIGYTLLGLQVAAVAAIATTYAIDSYKPVAGEFLVSATINKNLWGYGVTTFLPRWIKKAGYVTPIMTNTALALFFMGLGIPLYFYGKNVRRWSAKSSVHYK